MKQTSVHQDRRKRIAREPDRDLPAESGRSAVQTAVFPLMDQIRLSGFYNRVLISLMETHVSFQRHFHNGIDAVCVIHPGIRLEIRPVDKIRPHGERGFDAFLKIPCGMRLAPGVSVVVGEAVVIEFCGIFPLLFHWPHAGYPPVSIPRLKEVSGRDSPSGVL